MKTYNLYLTNPFIPGGDYERSVEAESKEEAVDEFYQDLGKHGWNKETLEQLVVKEDCYDCMTMARECEH